MLLTINLPNRESTLALHRQRWEELVSEARWNDVVERIETNAQGQIIMSPPPAEWHSNRQGQLIILLHQLLGGRVKPECPVITSDGVKAIDVGWFSDARHREVTGQVACEIAPEICVEVISPSNSASEIDNKFKLYFEAGAIECWQCDLQGRMSYTHRDQPSHSHSSSSLCPSFPEIISN